VTFQLGMQGHDDQIVPCWRKFNIREERGEAG